MPSGLNRQPAVEFSTAALTGLLASDAKKGAGDDSKSRG